MPQQAASAAQQLIAAFATLSGEAAKAAVLDIKSTEAATKSLVMIFSLVFIETILSAQPSRGGGGSGPWERVTKVSGSRVSVTAITFRIG